MFVVLAVVVSTIGCDRVTKNIAARRLAGRQRLSLVCDSIRLEYVENRGGFLSLGTDLPDIVRRAILDLGTAALLVWLGVWVVLRTIAGGWALGPALLWAGGAGNLVDRIARGSVIDFLNVGIGGVRTGIFNAADVAITAGVALVVVELCRQEGTRHAQAAAEEEVERVRAAAFWVAASLTAGSGPATQLVDISHDEKAPQKRQAVRFQAMDVLLIEVASGPRAVVQFTELGAKRGTYRWRCRRAGSSEVLSGVGTVAEKTEEVADGPGRGHVLPLPGNDTIVRAGEIRAAWSWADDRVGYLYYYTHRAKVTVLPTASFDKEP